MRGVRACVRACTIVRHQWALNDAAALACIKQTTRILHMCCLFNASDCGNGGYGAGCYASLLLTQVNHSAAEAWLVLGSSQVPGGGWVMFDFKCIMAMEHCTDVRIINDKCVALARQTRHTETPETALPRWKSTPGRVICSPQVSLWIKERKRV